MTIPTNYTTLQTAIEEDLARSDLTAELPNFINKGEAILNRELRLMNMETSSSETLAADADTLSLPTGFLEHINLRHSSDNWLLTQSAWDDLDDLKSTSTGRPSVYAIGTSIEFDQAADTEYTIKHRYFKKWDIATDTTNALLTNNPDIYIYASLVGSLSRTGNHARGEGWINLLDAAIKGLQRVDGRTRRQKVMRVDRSLLTNRKFNINRGW